MGLAVALAAASAAADWPGFRGDVQRRGASPDRLALPLTEIWRVPTATPGAVWRGRVVTVVEQQGRRVLLCLDARTGAVAWRQPLTGGRRGGPLGIVEPSDSEARAAGPVVTESGLVFVQDWTTRGGAGVNIGGGGVSFGFGSGSQPFLRVHAAQDGRPLALYPAPPLPPDSMTRLVFMDGGTGQVLRPVEGGASRYYEAVGQPLLAGETFIAAGMVGLFHWAPGEGARHLFLEHAAPTLDNPDASAAAMLHLYPLAASPAGLVAAGEGPASWFLTVLQGAQARWHRDLPWRPGVAAVERGLIFLNLGGPDAGRAMMAIDAATGVTRWTFAPDGLPPDPRPQGVGSGVRAGSSGIRAGTGPSFGGGLDIWGGVAPVLVQSRVFCRVGNAVVALEAESGKPVWERPFPPAAGPRSMVASRDHLLVRFPHHLVAYRLADGEPELEEPLHEGGGTLALSGGLLHLTDTLGLQVLAPAERTFALALDSDRPEHYHAGKPADSEPWKDVDPPLCGEPAAAGSGAEAERQPPVADMGLLSLRWGDPPALERSARARRQLLGERPMLLSLDWLDPTRAEPLPGADQPAAFAALCRTLAASAGPARLDAAPEVNAYLARHPERLEGVLATLAAARKAVREVAPETKLLLSLNAALLAGVYGRGTRTPFGPAAALKPLASETLERLVGAVDEVALTLRPQCGFRSPEEVPGSYLLALREALGGKALTVERIEVAVDTAPPKRDRQAVREQSAQAGFLRRTLQLCYWLDAPVVAYPTVLGQPSNPPEPAMGTWRDVPHWKRVERLTAAPASH